MNTGAESLRVAGRTHFGVLAAWSEALEFLDWSSDGYARLARLVGGDASEERQEGSCDWLAYVNGENSERVPGQAAQS